MKFYNFSFLSFVVFLVVSCAQGPKYKHQSYNEAYRKASEIIRLTKRKASPGRISSEANQLFEVTKNLMNDVKTNHKGCRVTIDEAAEQQDKILDLTFEEIKSQYLATAPPKTETCLTATQLLYQPLAVRSLAAEIYTRKGRELIISQLEMFLSDLQTLAP